MTLLRSSTPREYSFKDQVGGGGSFTGKGKIPMLGGQNMGAQAVHATDLNSPSFTMAGSGPQHVSSGNVLVHDRLYNPRPINYSDTPSYQREITQEEIAARTANDQRLMAEQQQLAVTREQEAANAQQFAAQAPYGLSGAQQALSGGLTGASTALQYGGQQASQNLAQGRNVLGGNFSASASRVDPNTGQPLFQQAASGTQAFTPEGLKAQQLQSALSGAQGQEAFNQALLDSPAQRFLREQGQEAVINQASAIGGLGSGNVQKELARYNQGLASTQLQQQINNLNALSGQGLQAAGQTGQFLSAAGQQKGNLASQNAQLATQASLANAANRLSAAQGQAQLFGQQAGIDERTGQNIANLISGTAGTTANLRSQAGRDLASQIGQSTSALSNLASQQGQGLSNIIGSSASNIANLLSGAGQYTGSQQMQLGQLLANLGVGQGSQLANISQGLGQSQAEAALREGQNQQQLIGNLAGATGLVLGSGG